MSIIKHSFWSLLSQILIIVFQFLLFILLTKSLTPAEFGYFSAIYAIVMTMGPFADLGSTNSTIGLIVANPKNTREYWGASLISSSIGGIITSLLGGFAGFVIFYPEISISTTLLIAFAELFFGIFTYNITSLLQALDYFAYAAIIRGAMQAMRCLAGSLLLIFSNGSVDTWALLNFLQASIFYVLVLWIAIRLMGRPILNASLVNPLRNQGLFFSIAGAAKTAYTDIDKVIVTKLVSPDAAGLLFAASRLVGIASIPLLSILNVTYFQFFSHGKEGLHKARDYAVKLIVPLVGITMISVMILLAMKKPLLSILGEQYVGAFPFLQILVFVVLLQAVSIPLGDALTGSNLQYIRTILQVVLLLFGAVVNFLLIGRFSVDGAIASRYFVEVGILLSYFFAITHIIRSSVYRGKK